MKPVHYIAIGVTVCAVVAVLWHTLCHKEPEEPRKPINPSTEYVLEAPMRDLNAVLLEIRGIETSIREIEAEAPDTEQP